MQDYCRYIPPKKDPNGNVYETKTEAMERIEKNKKSKIFEDYIKPIDLKMSQD